MTISDADLVEILHDLCQRYIITDIQDGEFTVRMFAKQHGIAWARARKAVKRAESDGLLRSVGKRREPDGVISEAFIPVVTDHHQV